MSKPTGNFMSWRSKRDSKELSSVGGRSAQDLARANKIPVTLPSPEGFYGGKKVTYLGGYHGLLYVGDEIVRRRN